MVTKIEVGRSTVVRDRAALSFYPKFIAFAALCRSEIVEQTRNGPKNFRTEIPSNHLNPLTRGCETLLSPHSSH